MGAEDGRSSGQRVGQQFVEQYRGHPFAGRCAGISQGKGQGSEGKGMGSAGRRTGVKWAEYGVGRVCGLQGGGQGSPEQRTRGSLLLERCN